MIPIKIERVFFAFFFEAFVKEENLKAQFEVKNISCIIDAKTCILSLHYSKWLF
jgi:hypothetical protein